MIAADVRSMSVKQLQREIKRIGLVPPRAAPLGQVLGALPFGRDPRRRAAVGHLRGDAQHHDGAMLPRLADRVSSRPRSVPARGEADMLTRAERTRPAEP